MVKSDILQQSILYVLLDTAYLDRCTFLPFTKSLIKGGVKLFQLRAKKESLQDIIKIALSILPCIHEANALLIINDYPEILRYIDADGVHVGQDDLSVVEVKRIIGSKKIIGKSTHSIEQVLSTIREGVDYIGFGPVFQTATKPNYQPIGIHDIKRLYQLVDIPVFCIGGIKLSRLPLLIEKSVQRVAVVSDILHAMSPTQHAIRYHQLLFR